MDQSYIYEELVQSADYHEIRLIRLLPSKDFDSPVRCTIFKKPLHDICSYEALSYAWGDLNSPKTIYVDEKPHVVMANLELALRYFRLPELERIIWADALCINQQNLPEKSSQVQIMRSIYLKAQQVVVWLGEEEDAMLATALCRLLRYDKIKEDELMVREKNDQKTYKNRKGLSKVLHRAFESYKPKLKKEESPKYKKIQASVEELEASKSLFSRPWWSRTWILQEVIHANNVHVYMGNLQIGFDELLDLHRYYEEAHYVSRMGDEFDSGRIELDETESGSDRRKAQALRGYWIGYLVGFSAGFTDMHIKYIKFARIYYKNGDQLSLSTLLDNFRPHLASNPRDKIYAFISMATEEDLAGSIKVDYEASVEEIYTDAARHLLMPILTQVESPDRPVTTTSALPSWVPDFTTRRQKISRVMDDGMFTAGISFSSIYSFAAFMAWLKQEQDRDSSPGHLRILGIYIGKVTSVAPAHITGAEVLKDNDQVQLFRYITDMSKRHQAVVDENAWPEPLNLATIFEVNWGPIWTLPGDIVVVVVGCPLPVILRPDDDHYLFVGCCWLIDSRIGIPWSPAGKKGFSPIIFGCECENIDEITQLEQFLLY